MKKTERRFFTVNQYKEEENWLNEMAARGWNLKKSGVFKYEFESGKPGEYTYRLELLDRDADSKESRQYINFLKETGIETVCECSNWIYLRRKSSDGPFNPENPMLSELSHKIRVHNVFSRLRNAFLVALGICAVIIMVFNFIEYSSPAFDFCKGFFEGMSFAICILLAITVPSFSQLTREIENTVKEMYLHE